MANGPLEAKLVISAEIAQAQAALKRLQGVVGATGKDLDQAGGAAFGKARKGVESISRQLSVARAQVGAFFAATLSVQTLRSLAQMADSYEGLNARLRLATSGEEAYQRAVARSTALASQYQKPLGDVATLYSRVASSLKGLADGQQRAEASTEALLAALKITGASTAESSSAILQFSQALAGGALRGEEFNAINEAAPRLLDALASSLGVTRGELRKLAEDGRLTTRVVTEAMQRSLPQLRAEAAAIPDAILPALGQVGDAFGKVVGEFNRATGASVSIVAALKSVAENMGAIAKVGAQLAAVVAALAFGRLASGLVAVATGATGAAAGLAGLRVAMTGALAIVGGPAGLIAAVLSLAAAYAYLSGQQRRAKLATIDGLEEEKTRLEKQLKQLESGRKDELSILPGATRQSITRTKRELADIDSKLDEMRGKERADRETAAELAREAQRGVQAPVALDPQTKKDKERRELYIARAREAFDKERELLADSLAREREQNQQAFDDGLRDLAAYMQRRGQLEDQAAELAIAKLADRLEAERQAVRENEAKLAKERDPEDRGRLQEAVAAGLAKVAEIEADITKQQRDQADAATIRLRETRALTDELRRQQQEISRALAESLGQSMTPEQIRAQVLAGFEDQIRRIRQLGGDDGQILRLVDVETTRQQLEQVAREYERVQNAIALREQALGQAVADGSLTTAEAEAQLLALRREQLPVLDEILARLDALAQSPDDRERIARLRAEVAGQRDLRTELEKTARSQAVSSIAGALDDITLGASSAKDALLDMVRSFATAMLRALNQRLAEQLVKQFADAAASSGSSGGGNWLAGAAQIIGSFFHQGGVVGAGGVRQQALPAATWALAPRYHTGGIAGLMPDEVPAILRKGEEVLTADDPRHSRNSRTAGGVSVVNQVSISGAQGDAGRLRGVAEQLTDVVNGAINAWAVQQSRPGGLLSGR